MRTRTTILTATLLLGSGGGAWAQEPPASQAAVQQPVPTVNSAPLAVPKIGLVDFGARTDSLSGDQARYNRFRDLRGGPVISRFRVAKESETWFLGGEAFNVGYRD